MSTNCLFLLSAIPAEEAEQNDNIAIVITSHGGHIGFMEGLFPRHEGYMDRLFSQYVKAVFTHGPQHLKQDWSQGIGRLRATHFIILCSLVAKLFLKFVDSQKISGN